MEQNILEKAHEFAKSYLPPSDSEKFPYHNYTHTLEVVEAAREIGKHCELSEDEMEMVELAAWLHDIGYVISKSDHEEESKNLANKFLDDQQYDDKKILLIEHCIEATKMPQKPTSLMEKVLCDADLYHLSTKSFQEKGLLLRKEFELNETMSFTDEEWKKENLNFVLQHRYFTNYGQTILAPKKDANFKALKKTAKKNKNDKKYIEKLEAELVKVKNKLDQNKIIKPDRGIETMFRTTSRNHLDLSSMADSKANIMISINSIILSIVVSVLVRKLEDSPNLVIPTVLLTVVCLTTIVFAILATRPNVSTGRFSKEDIRKKRTNLLFFGNFHGMDKEEYEWGMKEMIKDADYLYTSLIRDIYFLGKVLGKKYRMLRVCYTIFMFGFVISVMSFIIAMVFFNPIDHY